MHAIAAAGSGGGMGIWAYLAAFAATAAGYTGIPFTGAVAIGAAAAASQGQLNIAAVLIGGGPMSTRPAGCWASRPATGRQFLEHPVPALKMRKKAVAKGEEVCKQWGRAAVPLSWGPAGAWHDRPAGTTGARCSGHAPLASGAFRTKAGGKGKASRASADVTDSRHPVKGPLAC